MNSAEQILKSHVEGQLMAQGEDLDLSLDDDLLMAGLDSIGFLRLVEFVQTEFSLEVPASDVTVEQFGTIERIAQYVGSRRQAE